MEFTTRLPATTAVVTMMETAANCPKYPVAL